MESIIVLSDEEIIEINKKFNGGVKKGELDFILSKIRSIKLGSDLKMDIAKSAAILWYYVIQNHVFVDGNKRTATEAAKLLCMANAFEINLPSNGFIYISLKIANNDMKLKELIELVHSRLKRQNA